MKFFVGTVTVAIGIGLAVGNYGGTPHLYSIVWGILIGAGISLAAND